MVSKDRFRELYDFVTSEPYGFMYITSAAKDVNEMFYLRVEYPLEP